MPDYRLITNLLYEPKGMHDPSKTYKIKDTVTSSDGSMVYFALKDVPAGIALTNTAYWINQIDLSNVRSEMLEATDAAHAAADKANAAPTVSFFIDPNGNATVDGKVLAVDENGDATI